jgi:hypothetical protein
MKFLVSILLLILINTAFGQSINNSSIDDLNDWNFFTISHSQKNKINLYVRQEKELVEIYITECKSGKILIHDKLKGYMNELKLDQFNSEVSWVVIKKSFNNQSIQHDMVEARERNGSSDNLYYIKYHIANAINSSYSNKKFSRYLKQNLVGTWVADNLELQFSNDGKLTIYGEAPRESLLFLLPKNGTYNIENNMLFIMNDGEGIRSQVVNLVDNKLIFPGSNGQLFYIMKKK